MDSRQGMWRLLGALVVLLGGCTPPAEITRTNTAEGMGWFADCETRDHATCVEAAKEKCNGGFRTIDRTERGEITIRKRPNGTESRRKERSTTLTFICEHQHTDEEVP